MKKMNKMYEAPVAEVIEMQSVTILMASGGGDTGSTGSGTGSSAGGGGFEF